MLPYLIAIPLIAHGLANLGGFFASWLSGDLGFGPGAWLLPGKVTLKSNPGRLLSLAWLLSTVFLLMAGAGLLTAQPIWLPLALAGCGLSLVVIVAWWRAIPPGAKFGAFFDAVALGVLLSPLAALIS